MSLVIKIVAFVLNNSLVSLECNDTSPVSEVFSKSTLVVHSLLEKLAWPVALAPINPAFEFIAVWKVDECFVT
jgi:hypothetical protein